MPKDDLVESLKLAYGKFKVASENGDNEAIEYMRGFSYALERVGLVYKKLTATEIEEIKRSIIGNVSMSREEIINLDEPTYIRRKK
jgi:ABC-type multidrug transport system ATPase subunit